MKLSVIIPVYNVEVYLSECVLSLYQSGLSTVDFEVLLINDGSTDGSFQIACELSKKYMNIRVFTQENQGLSATRNRGILEAKGDYIFFLDSDDFIYPNVLPILLKKAFENNLDILRFEYWNVTESGEKKSLSKYKNKRKLFEDKIGDGYFLLENVYNREFYACFSLIKRSFLIQSGVKFTQGMYYEDIEFTISLSTFAKRAMYISKPLYAYRNRVTSIVNTFNRKKATDLIMVASRLRKLANQEEKVISHVLEENVTNLMIFVLLRISEPSLFKERTLLLDLMKEEGLEYLYPQKSLKERFIPILYNIMGCFSIYFLSPISYIKNKYITKNIRK